MRGRLKDDGGEIFTIFGAVGPPSGGLWELVGAFGRFLGQLGWTSLGSFGPKGS